MNKIKNIKPKMTHHVGMLSVIISVFILVSARLCAQTPSDALLMESGQACVLLDYNFSSFDHYWEGKLKRDNQTIATVQRQSTMAMMAFGILDNLNFYIGVPYIKTNSTEPNGGKFAGVSGIQDLSVAIKYRFLNRELNNGQLSSFATVGFSTPVTNYLSDYMPYSIGLGAPELSYRLILQYETDQNSYVRAAGTYIWRGYTEVEREYYYNNGSYFTPWMDVPSGVTLDGVIGKWFFKKALQVELNYSGLKSLSGDDIRPYNAAQPTNKVNFDLVGAQVRYYVKEIKGLGFVAYHKRIVNGRNAPMMNTTGFGITYFFDYLKQKKS